MTKAQLLRINFPMDNLESEILIEFNLSVKLWLAAETTTKKYLGQYDPIAVRNEYLNQIKRLDEISKKLARLREELMEEVEVDTVRFCYGQNSGRM